MKMRPNIRLKTVLFCYGFILFFWHFWSYSEFFSLRFFIYLFLWIWSPEPARAKIDKLFAIFKTQIIAKVIQKGEKSLHTAKLDDFNLQVSRKTSIISSDGSQFEYDRSSPIIFISGVARYIFLELDYHGDLNNKHLKHLNNKLLLVWYSDVSVFKWHTKITMHA